MNQTARIRTSRGNQPMEVFRLIASILVLFVHVQFPGKFGSAVNCLARCAVPGFFALSGFFCYGVSSKKIGRRMGKLVGLIVISFAVEVLWGCFLVEREGGSTIAYLRAVGPDAFKIPAYVILNMNPIWDAYWYLPAVLEAMVALWLYVRFQEDGTVSYRSFYTVGICLFACNLAMGIIGIGAGNPGAVYQYRNGVFFGIPLFAMGLFLGEHWQRIITNFSLTNRKLAMLAVVSLGFSMTEWFGFGSCDVLVGSVAEVVFLILLMAKNPVISRRSGVQKLIGILGALSTGVYVLHPLVIDFYDRFLLERLSVIPREPWLRPLMVLGITMVCAMVWVWTGSIAGKRKK